MVKRKNKKWLKKQKGGIIQWILMKKLLQGGGRINKRKRKRKLNQKGGYMKTASQDQYKKASSDCSIM